MTLSSSLTIHCVDTRHPLYAAEVDLRVAVLRTPLGLARETVFFPFEDESLHFVALTSGRVIGCVLFHQKSETLGRLFQMAVDPTTQRSGVGTKLVNFLEHTVRALGVKTVRLHARQDASRFYERLGYTVASESYIEVGIPHRVMVKNIFLFCAP